MTTETLLPDPSLSLEQAFSAVAQRMQGLGFVNPALRVQAIGVQVSRSRAVAAGCLL